jgi:hypothetical protein
MLREIIEKAARLKLKRQGSGKPAKRGAARSPKKTSTKRKVSRSRSR